MSDMVGRIAHVEFTIRAELRTAEPRATLDEVFARLAKVGLTPQIDLRLDRMYGDGIAPETNVEPPHGLRVTAVSARLPEPDMGE